MFGLSRDFARNGGTFMILNKEGGLKTDDLNSVQTRMLTSNRIPGLLELRIKEVDFQIELHYDISGKRMLSQVWKGGSVSTSDFYRILFEVADTLHRSPQYMLNIRQFMLHEDYIFVSGSGTRETVSLTYIPLCSVQYPEQTGSYFKQMIIRLLTRVAHSQGGFIQRILDLCDRNEFEVGALKELLLQGMAAGEQSVGGQDEDKSSIHSSHTLQGNYTDRGERTYRQEHRETLQEIQELKRVNQLKQSIKPEENVEVGTDEEMEDAEPKLQQYKTYIALGCLLASAIVWRYIYLDHPETVPLLISIVLTLVLVAVAYISWMGKLERNRASAHLYSEAVPVLDSEWLGTTPSAQRKNDRYQVDKLTGFVAGRHRQDKQSFDLSDQGRESWRWTLPNSESKGVGNQAAGDREKVSTNYDLHEPSRKGIACVNELDDSDTSEAYYKSLSGVTELLNTMSKQETVLLRPDQEIQSPPNQHSPIACLDRKLPGSGETERIRLQPDQFVGGSFIIGRDPQLVQFVEHTDGVSRSHIELCIVAGGQNHMVKDLSSTNGTVLNEEPMVPYKEYAIKEGDTFKIAGVSYTYRLDSFKSSDAS
ncbi:FHA domain-containing protein [Paenibacillus polymyxa]|nr:FHA domain-containing protein [Paenibacillus polymyxa]